MLGYSYALHGLGADGHDLAPLMGELMRPGDPPARFIFPHAPFRPVTINGGYIMRAWYDIATFDISQPEDADGIHASAGLLNTLIQREIHRGIAAHHIVLAGFSQGGAIALHVGLRYPQRLAGILALSTYLPLAATVTAERHPANLNTPVFMGHGREDTILPLHYGSASKQLLQDLAYPVEWHSYDMPHSLCDEEINDIIKWLTRTLTT